MELLLSFAQQIMTSHVHTTCISFSILISSASLIPIGVSMTSGISARRGSFMRQRNISRPILPLPRFSCLSRWHPRSPLESLRCMPRRNLSPTTSSNSCSMLSNPSLFLISKPAAKAWQVSIQTPTLVLSSTWSIILRISSNRPPTVFPCRDMFSMTAVTPLVQPSALFILSPIVLQHSSTVVSPQVDPGWKLYKHKPRVSHRRISSINASLLLRKVSALGDPRFIK